MSWLKKFFRRRKANYLNNAAMEMDSDKRYAASAADYSREADVAVIDNELIAADDHKYAFEECLKGGDAKNALAEARASLHCYTLGDWLKGDNSYIDDLTGMVGDLEKADHVDEADAFLTDINSYLTSIGEQPVVVTLTGKQRSYPPLCPHCGGEISYHGTLTEISCPYCSAVIHAL